MTVYELIVALKAFPPDLKVGFEDVYYGMDYVKRVTESLEMDPYTFTTEKVVKLS